MTKKSINIYGNRHPKRGALVANPIPFENKFWYDIFQPIVDAINKLYTGASNVFKSSETIWLGVDNTINVNKEIFNKIGDYSLFGGQNIPCATINGQQIIGNNSNIIIESGHEYIAGENVSIVDNIISATNTTYSAGTNINITNNVIKADGYIYNTIIGSFTEGDRDINDGGSIRPKPSATGVMAHAEGSSTTASGAVSHSEGYNTITNNFTEHAEGSLNVSHKNSTFGSANATQHSIGIGVSNTRKNAVEVMQNGDIYIYGVGYYDGVYIKNESGAPIDLQTLQEVINSLGWKIRILEPVKNNEIRYKTSNEETIYPSMQESYISLDYNEKGIIIFDNDLTQIDDNAFEFITSLIEIELPEHEYFIRIGQRAFIETGLKEIIIPKYIAEIGDNAFSECYDLKTIKYNGTMDDWNNIILGSDIFLNTQVAEIICINGIVSI